MSASTRPLKSSKPSAAASSKRSKQDAAAAPAAQPVETPVARKAKPVAAAKPAKKVKPAATAKPAKPVKPAKAKLVRDSFTMPQADFDLVQVLKDRALEFKRAAKKSELLRAGLRALAAFDAKALQTALDALTPVKTGRPKKAD